jgi:hypothetical protein
LLAAVALADLSLHVDRGGLLVAGTAVFALLAITANGPLGLVRVVPRRLHVYAVCVVAVVFALAPILPQIRPDVSGIIIIEFAAVGIFRLATMTSTVVTVRAPRGSRASTKAASPTVATPRPATEAAPRSAMGADAAPQSGTGAESPQPAPETVSTSETAGRWISRQAGAAVQHAGIAAEAAALTAEKHAPAARAQAGRAVRSAGRLTGRLTRSVGTAPSSSGPASGPPSGSSGPAPGSPPAAGEPSETTDVQGPEDPK